MENPEDDPREFHQTLPGGLEDGYPPGMDNFLSEYSAVLREQLPLRCCASPLVGLNHLLGHGPEREHRSPTPRISPERAAPGASVSMNY